MKIELVLPNAKIPTKKRKTDAGWDLYTPISFTLDRFELRIIDIGIKLKIPDGTVAIIKGKSKLASRGVLILGGVIDDQYTGNWGIILFNCGIKDLSFYQGEAIAQFLLFENYNYVNIELVEELPETDRGEEGIWTREK